jgi:hypothetical protein
VLTRTTLDMRLPSAAGMAPGVISTDATASGLNAA